MSPRGSQNCVRSIATFLAKPPDILAAIVLGWVFLLSLEGNLSDTHSPATALEATRTNAIASDKPNRLFFMTRLFSSGLKRFWMPEHVHRTRCRRRINQCGASIFNHFQADHVANRGTGYPTNRVSQRLKSGTSITIASPATSMTIKGHKPLTISFKLLSEMPNRT